MEYLKYRFIYEYEFYLGTSAAETARRVNHVYSVRVAKKKKTQYVLGSNIFVLEISNKLQNKPRDRPETQVDNECSIDK